MGDEPAAEVTAAILLNGSNAVSATVVVFAVAAGTITVALQGSNDLSMWTHLGDIADTASVGSIMGQVAGVPTAYVRALATLVSDAGESAQCIVGIQLHTSSL